MYVAHKLMLTFAIMRCQNYLVKCFFFMRVAFGPADKGKHQPSSAKRKRNQYFKAFYIVTRRNRIGGPELDMQLKG